MAVSIMPFECACVNAHEGILHRVIKTRNKQWPFRFYCILSLELGKVNNTKIPKASISTHSSHLSNDFHDINDGTAFKNSGDATYERSINMSQMCVCMGLSRKRLGRAIIKYALRAVVLI